MTAPDPLAHRCPTCGSSPGQACHRMDPVTLARTSKVIRHPHPARRHAARQETR